ncbi:MAG: hypothetical protein F6K47_08450 [Symploca sp. SIO2E6]|nr:hypothetical protein [Symploca sp. SIO2E6]
MGNGEWGMGNGEWREVFCLGLLPSELKVGIISSMEETIFFPIPYSLFPVP